MSSLWFRTAEFQSSTKWTWRQLTATRSSATGQTRSTNDSWRQPDPGQFPRSITWLQFTRKLNSPTWRPSLIGVKWAMWLLPKTWRLARVGWRTRPVIVARATPLLQLLWWKAQSQFKKVRAEANIKLEACLNSSFWTVQPKIKETMDVFTEQSKALSITWKTLSWWQTQPMPPTTAQTTLANSIQPLRPTKTAHVWQTNVNTMLQAWWIRSEQQM